MIICHKLHASVLALLMDVPHVIVDGGSDTHSYVKNFLTRAAALETSEHCNQDALRCREAATLEEGIGGAVELLHLCFGEK